MLSSAVAIVHRDQIIRLAPSHQLPTVYFARYFVAAGGLISYGPDTIDPHRRAAVYVDRILKGEKPADLPVQAPTKYELVINLKTAKALGIDAADAAMMETQLGDVETAARAMALHIQMLKVDTTSDIDAAFKTFGRERPDAVFVTTSPFLNGRRIQLAQLAAFHHLPATYALRDYVEAGGLMSYGSNIVEGYRQVGIYVGRVLKCAKPTDLPIVQATKYELVVNAKTAKALGLEIPPTLLARADEVIE